MLYHGFKQYIDDYFLNYMPVEYRDNEIEIHAMKKEGRIMEMMYTVPFYNQNWKLAPSVCLSDLYESHRQGESIDTVLEKAAALLSDHLDKMPQISEEDLRKERGNIIPSLINTEENRALLWDIPHREFQNLSIVYRWALEQGEEWMVSAPITHPLAELFHMDEEMLYQAAMENAKSLLPVTVKSQVDYMHEVVEEMRAAGDMIEFVVEDIPPEQQFYIISNKKMVHGAMALVYGEDIQKLAETLDSDLYLLPSSIHEVIAVSVKESQSAQLTEMVESVNMSVLSEEEFLSDQIYLYDKEKKMLSIVDDAPSKEMDSIKHPSR